MRAQLKKLSTDTAIYGISSILGRFLNFLLVPLYTNIFPSQEYGIIAPIYSYMAFLNVIVPIGMETAYMRYVSTLELGSKKDTFSTPFLSVAGIALIGAIVIQLCSGMLSPILQIKSGWEAIVPLCAWTIAIDAMCIIPFASLRMDNKARLFAGIRFVSIVVTVGLNVWLVAFLHHSIVSIFIAGIIGSSISLILLLPTVIKNLSIKISKKIFSSLLKVGLPTVPAALAGIMIQVIDRPIMLYLTDANTSGIYQANYKLGIFMMLFVSMFQYAWQPFYLQMAKEENARPLFARVLTYYIIIAAFIFLCLTFFIEPLIKISFFGYHLLGTEYWSGVHIVPIILLAYLFTGTGVVLSAGLLIEKKTTYMPFVMGLSAVINIIANVLLIPSLGIVGAALATLMSYIIASLAYFMITIKIYPVPYEYYRLIKIAFATAIPVILFYIGWTPFEIPDIVWRTILCVLFVPLLILFRFFEANEFRVMKQLANRFSF